MGLVIGLCIVGGMDRLRLGGRNNMMQGTRNDSAPLCPSETHKAGEKQGGAKGGLVMSGPGLTIVRSVNTLPPSICSAQVLSTEQSPGIIYKRLFGVDAS